MVRRGDETSADELPLPPTAVARTNHRSVSAPSVTDVPSFRNDDTHLNNPPTSWMSRVEEGIIACRRLQERVTASIVGASRRLRHIRRKRSASDDNLAASEEAPEKEETDGSFQYNPSSTKERLLVGIGAKNHLDVSRIVYIRIRQKVKYSLLLILFLMTLFLTPDLVPKWAGFHWVSTADLCSNSDDKLQVVEQVLLNATNYTLASHFVVKQRFILTCMNESARQFYHGSKGSPPRFEWPHECTRDKAMVSLVETRCSRASNEANGVCASIQNGVGAFATHGASCVTENAPEVCVNSTDSDRADALLELELARARAKNAANASVPTADAVMGTANDAVKQIAERLIRQLDIAADAFVIYSMIAIAVGVPLVIYRRERTSLVVGAMFGLTKIWFIAIFIIVMSVYDAAHSLLSRADFSVAFRNFLRDPCYLHPEFSAKRVSLIAQTCNDVAKLSVESDTVLQQMDNVYYDTRLFGYCEDAGRVASPHPKLDVMDQLRAAYRSGDLQLPASCNASKLDALTSGSSGNQTEFDELRSEHQADSPHPQSGWIILIASGVLPQLLLKFILTGWTLHAFAFAEPMLLHNGKVEIWGARRRPLPPPPSKPRVSSLSTETDMSGRSVSLTITTGENRKGREEVGGKEGKDGFDGGEDGNDSDDDDCELTRDEKEAIKRFSRDKHLLPLVVFSILMVMEAILIIYSVINTIVNAGSLPDTPQPKPISPDETLELQCPPNLFA